MLTVILTCVTDSPISDGTINEPMRLTPGWPGSNRKPNSMPRRLSPGNCMANCAAPPATTPIATPRIGSGNVGERNSAQPMMKTLKKTGDRAGAAKARSEFRTPMASAARLMNNRYGNMIRVSSVVNASLVGSSWKPGASTQTMPGAARMPRSVITVTSVSSVVNMALASSHASRLVRRIWYSVKTGMKADDIEPSAKSSRSRLGMR